MLIYEPENLNHFICILLWVEFSFNTYLLSVMKPILHKKAVLYENVIGDFLLVKVHIIALLHIDYYSLAMHLFGITMKIYRQLYANDIM